MYFYYGKCFFYFRYLFSNLYLGILVRENLNIGIVVIYLDFYFLFFNIVDLFDISFIYYDIFELDVF